VNRWKNVFNQVLNLDVVRNVRQKDIHTAEPLVPEPSLVEVKIAIGKLKSYKFSGTDQISAELIKAGVKHYILRYTDLFVVFGIRRNCHSSGMNLLLYQFIKRVIRLDGNNYRGISLLSTAYKILSKILLARLTPYVNEIIGDHQCGFRRYISTTDQIFYIRQILEKKWDYNGTVHQLFIDFKKAYDSITREVLYNILVEFGIPKKLVRLIKMCLN
jgi:hypothetical protein